MGKWDFIIETLLRDLESEIADGPGPIRSNIDDKIREAEQIVPRLDREISTRERKTALPHFCASYAGLYDSV